MTGANPAAARASGVNPKAMIMKTILISGALAGLAASGFLLTTFPKYSDAFPLTLPFTGIAVALLGRNHPAGIAVAALGVAGHLDPSRGLLDAQIPPEISQIMLGTLLISSGSRSKSCAAAGSRQRSAKPSHGPASTGQAVT